jgi:ubiquinone/menaquinone biosynthesis C-methylase UbiE
MAIEHRPTLAQGESDPFGRVESWDSTQGAHWVRALDQRAENPDQVQMRAAILDIANITPGQTAVEIGCGTGVLMVDLAEAVGKTGKVVGVEPQPFLAEAARQRFAARGFADRCTVNVTRGSAESMGTAIADVCIAQTVLNHLPDLEREATLLRMIAVTRQGGWVISADQDADTWVIDHPDQDVTRRIVASYCQQSFSDGWVGRRQRRAFLKAGLQEVTVRVIPMVDTSTDSFTFERTAARSQVAVKAGWITEEEQRRWIAVLNDLAGAGLFFTSTNFFITAGRVPRGATRVQ